MKILKTAVIGLGRIGWSFHLPQINAHPGFELCAVSDLSDERIREAEETYHIKGFTDVQKMLSTMHPEVVVIASPTHLHKKHTQMCMQAGADVFLDKPMASSYKEAKEIEREMISTGRKVMVFQPHRAIPEVATLKQIFASNLLGPIFMIKRALSCYERRNDWQTLRKFGGGMLTNFGAHFIDQMMFLTESSVENSVCRCHRIASLGDAEDVVKIILDLDSGITVDIDICCATALPIIPWMIFGKYGTAVYDMHDGSPSFLVKYYDPHEVEERVIDESLAAKDRAYSTDCKLPWKTKRYSIDPSDQISFYDKCYDYFAMGDAPFVPLTESLQLMNIIESMKSDSRNFMFEI